MRCTNQYFFFLICDPIFATNTVEPSPIQSGRTHTVQRQPLCLLKTATLGTHTHRQSQAKSSPTTVDDSKSLEATCPVYISWTPVIVGDSCSSESRTACGTVDSLVKGHQTIYNASGCEHINRHTRLGKKHTADGRR